MTFLEAMMLINEGNKVRLNHWREHEYIYLNDDNEVCWSNGNIVESIPNVGGWELYDDRKYSHSFWRKLYRSINDLAPDYQRMLDSSDECNGDCCGLCAFRHLCKMYDDIFMTLEYFNSEYKLDKKELPEDYE